jgi:serine/threonine protein kinase
MQFRSGQLERGDVIGGYRIDELINRGGMGAVFRATNVALNRIYALKVIAPELAGDDQFRDRFKREMRIAASLHNPHVVGIHYAGEQDGLLFLVMDFVYGTDLREVILSCGALEPDRAVDLLGQVATALDAAHSKGLVHRDVKPGNILITVRDGEEHAYLTDFGLAKRSDTVGALTQIGAVLGTVDYMSPEQVSGGMTDARTDIYALGCVFFQMLTGNVPYERENSVATLFAHVHDPPPPLDPRLTDTHPAFGAVVAEAMAKAPSDRYASAGDFARDAAAALRGSRYTGPPSLVATGDAKPIESPPPEGRSVVAETAIEREAEHEPGSAHTAAPGASPTAGPRSASTPGSGPAPTAPLASGFSDPHGARSSNPAGSESTAPPSSQPPPAPSSPAPATGHPSPPGREPEGMPTVAPGATSAASAMGAEKSGPPPTVAASAGSTSPPPSGGGSAPPSGGGSAPPIAWPPQGAEGMASGPPQGPPTGPPGGAQPPSSGGGVKRYRWPALAALVAIVAVVVAVVAGSSGSSPKPPAKNTSAKQPAGQPAGQRVTAAETPVPTNHVTGSGTASILLNGNVATVRITSVGLLDGSPHLIHIHAGGQGICPPASAARLHNGHLAISTGNGIRFYGPPLVSLTLRGDTSARSNLAFPRFPAVGAIKYERVVRLLPAIADLIRGGNAVLVIHGIDYDHSGTYDEVLGPSDLAPQFTGDSTAPALCGHLAPTGAVASAPSGQHTVYAASLNEINLAGSDQVSGFAALCHLPAFVRGRIAALAGSSA